MGQDSLIQSPLRSNVMTNSFVGYENLPNIYITDIYLENNTPKDYIVNLGLCLMDMQQSEGSIWSLNEDLRKYIKIGFIRTTNSKMQEELTSGLVSPHPSLVIKSKFWNFSSEIDIYSPAEFSKNTENGRIEFKKRLKFTEKYSTKNLAVFAFVYLDTEEISNDYKIELSGILKEYTGALVSEKVIEDMNPIERTHLFLRPDRTVWAGPVHYHPEQGYMEGSFHTSGQHNALEKMTVKNYKLVDGRKEHFQIRKDQKSENNVLLSSLYYSINNQVDLYGLFSFDVKRFVIQKTEYGRKLHQLNNGFFREYLKRIKINSLAISRQQIKIKQSYNRLGTLRDSSVNVGTHESIGNTIDHGDGKLIQTDDIREIFLDSNSLVRHFQFFDTKQDSKSSGIFKYTVELTIVDNSQIFIDEKISELEAGLNKLKELVFEYNSPSNYDYSKDMLKSSVEMKPEIINIIKNYYIKKSYLDKVSDEKVVQLVEKDTKSFLTANYRSTTGDKFLNDYQSLVTRFRRKFNVSRGYKVGKDKPRTIKSGDIPNLITLRKQFDPVIDFEEYRRFYDFLNINKDIRSAITKQEYFNRGAMEIDRFFDNAKSKDSLDFKDIPSKVKKSLKELKKSSLVTLSPVRFQFEKESVNIKDLDKINSSNLFRLFDLSNQREKERRSKKRNIFSNFQSDNRVTDSKSKRKKEKIIKPFSDLRTKAFAYELKKPDNTIQQIQKQYNIGSNIYLGNGSEFPFIDDRVDNPATSRFRNSLERSLTSAMDYSIPRSKNNFDVTKPNNFLDQFVKSRRPSYSLLEKAPICWKALVLSNTPSAKNNIIESELDILQDSTSKIATEMIFQTSQVVEMLVGYQRDKNGMTILSAPIWMEFDENVLSDTRATICRLRYLEVPQFGIMPLQMFKLPVVNSTFIISDRPLGERLSLPETLNTLPLDSSQINNIGPKNEISKNIHYARSNVVTQIKSKDSFQRSYSSDDLPPGDNTNNYPLQPLEDIAPPNKGPDGMLSSKRRSRRRTPSSRMATTNTTTRSDTSGDTGGY